MYSHKGGEDYIRGHYSTELQDIETAIANIDAVAALCKRSEEKTKEKLIFSPVFINHHLKTQFCDLGWTTKAPNSRKGFREPRISMGNEGEYLEIDGIKNKVGLEIQFGKYPFMAYDIIMKMPIFSKRRLIDCGIEIVPMPSIVKNMSTGVSSFNQIVAALKERGEADLDIPVLIIGIDCDNDEWEKVAQKRAAYERNPDVMHQNGEVLGARKGSKPGPKNFFAWISIQYVQKITYWFETVLSNFFKSIALSLSKIALK